MKQVTMLTALDAAVYTGRSLRTLLLGVAAGEWPGPIAEGRHVRLWDRLELDACIKRQSGGHFVIAG
jgi:hypothetical protein